MTMSEDVPTSSSETEATNLKTQNTARLKKLMVATREANKLPKKGGEFEMLSSFPTFSQLMQVEGDRILKMMNLLCRNSGCKMNFLGEGKMDEDEMLEKLVDVNDSILERVGNFLDEAEGRRKKEELMVVDGPSQSIRTSWNRKLHEASTTESDDTKSLAVKRTSAGNVKFQAPPIQNFQLGAKKIINKPQAAFSSHIDNSNLPFRTKLKFKHNPLKNPKGSQLKLFVDGEKVDSAQSEQPDQAEETHPYKSELLHLEPLGTQLMAKEPQKPQELDAAPLQWIDTLEDLEKLCQTLKALPEFAVDLEHHDYRTFLGLTCLMQISTRTTDYIVDTLALWKDIHILNDPFTDPTIVKVLHGANHDILWLQRDFGIYVVNMFDTGQAMKSLKFHKFSLLYLVQHYCSVNLKKQYQMADWRIRPLSPELMDYARSDTHYLLYCYDMLSNQLISRSNKRGNIIRDVLKRSADICLQVYQKPMYDPEDYQKVYQRCKQRFNSRQLWALKELYAWRNAAARREDESCGYVIPDHMLLQIAEVLPKEMSGILACCSPVPALVRKEQHELYRIVLKAREKPLDAKMDRSLSTPKLIQKQTNHPLIHNFHDFSHASRDEEIKSLKERLKQPDTIPDNPVPSGSDVILKKEPSLDIGPSSTNSACLSQNLGKESPSRKKKTAKQAAAGNEATWSNEEAVWISPYEQYLLAEEAAKTLREAAEAAKPPESQNGHNTDGPTSDIKQEVAEIEEEEVEEASKDLPADDDFAQPPPKKFKKKKGKWGPMFDPDQAQQNFKPVDYESMDPSQFNAKGSKAKQDVFDPNRSAGKKPNKKMAGGKKKNRFGDVLAKTFSFASKK